MRDGAHFHRRSLRAWAFASASPVTCCGPLGKRVVDKPNAGAGSALMNIVWFLVAGLWLVIGHITTAAAQAVTIIGT